MLSMPCAMSALPAARVLRKELSPDLQTVKNHGQLPGYNVLGPAIRKTNFARQSAACMPQKKPCSPNNAWAKTHSAASLSWMNVLLTKSTVHILKKRAANMASRINTAGFLQYRKILKLAIYLCNMPSQTGNFIKHVSIWSYLRLACSPQILPGTFLNYSIWN